MTKSMKDFLLEKGTVLNGKWEILEHIATGGMAKIYRARQIRLDREVAVKVLSEEFLSTLEENKEEIQGFIERFHREVKAMAQVRHPNVLQVYDQDREVLHINGDEHSIEYIAMEYIPGPNLRSTMPNEGLAKNEEKLREWIRDYFLPILDGMKTVHALGIVHRDLKPENVLLDGFIPKIADFGLAGGTRWKRVTQTHHVFGTVPYQASEQFVDMAETDIRADIYSLGKILYECISGKMTQKTGFVFQTAHLSNPDTPFLKRLDHVIRQATARDKKDRIPSVEVFRKALLEALEGEHVRARMPEKPKKIRIRRPLILFGLLAVFILGSVLFHLFYHREKITTPSDTSQPPISDSNRMPTGSQQPAALQPPPALDTSPALSVQGKDGVNLRLVPAGEVNFPENAGHYSGKLVKVDSFYMDETEITNHQYVEFLNRVIQRVSVEGELVKGEGKVWMLLGEVSKNYEPIIFRDGNFSIEDPAVHSNPVVRVTGYGASAYAEFFGRRLPTEAEWMFAMLKGGIPSQSSSRNKSQAEETTHMEMMHRGESTTTYGSTEPSQVISPVNLFLPNSYGIRGLAVNVREWSLQTDSNQTKKPQFIVLPSAVKRNPWEAFENVGFRCAVSAKKWK